MAEPAHELQAAVEGVALPREHTDDGVVTVLKVEFLGEEFRIADKVGLMPLMKFAHAASAGLASEDLEGMAAMYAMLRNCIHGDDWPRFEQHAMNERADGDDLFPVIARTVELLSARPTPRPSDSSGGPQPTSASSRDTSPSPEPPAPSPIRRPPPPGLVSVDSLAAPSTG